MTLNPPVNLESLRLKLIHGAGQSQWDVTFKKDGLRYLVKALAYADTAFSAEIEELLFKAGQVAVPVLVKGLLSKYANVRSVCAMVLIRQGKTVEADLYEAYNTMATPTNQWIFQFIFEELGMDYVPMAKALMVPVVKRLQTAH